jgi:hypothetical protein
VTKSGEYAIPCSLGILFLQLGSLLLASFEFLPYRVELVREDVDFVLSLHQLLVALLLDALEAHLLILERHPVVLELRLLLVVPKL